MKNYEFVKKTFGQRGNRTRSNQRITILGITILFTLLVAGSASFVHAETYTYVTSWGSSGSGNGQFGGIRGVAVDDSGNIYAVDASNNRVQEFTSTGTYVTQWGSYGSGNSQFNTPYGVAVGSSGNVYVADTGNNRIQEFTSTGTYVTSWGNRGSGNSQFTNPYCVAVGSSGNVYVADTGNNRIQEFTSTGTYVTSWGSSGSGNGQFNYPFGIAVDDSGNIYVADVFNNRIQEFNSTGTYVTSWGSSGSGNGQLSNSRGVAVDDSGNVYIADSGNNRIQKFTNTGTYVTQWGSSGSGNDQFNYPFGVAVDDSGNVYVADSNNNRVEKFSASTDKTITFTESGLPSGTSWTVTFNGTQHTSTTNTLTFTIADGSYSWNTSTTISGETGTQYVASSASGTLNTPDQTSQNISYTTQYYLMVTSDHGSPSGQGWYNAGVIAAFGVTSPDVADTTRYVLSSWASADTGSYTGTDVSHAVTMNNSVTETAQWKTQYLMVFSNSGLGSDGMGNLVSYNVSGGAMSGDASPISVSGGSFWVDAGATVTYSFVNPVTSSVTGKQYQLDSVTGLTSPITVSGASTLTSNYVTQWQVTFAVSGGGSTSPTGSNVWENAGSLNISATANSGYLFSTWSSNTGSITFTNTSSDSTTTTIGGTGTITASFAINTNSVTITVSQGLHGTIAPGTASVNYGDDQEFSFTPATSYHLVDVLVNGTSVLGSVEDGVYTVSNVTGPTTISASFAIDTFAITVTQNDHGTISPETTNVNYGNTQEFTFTPTTGYNLTDVLMNGTSVMQNVENNAYTVINVTGTTTLSATFAINTYTITVTQGDNGTVAPATLTVSYGGSQVFVITPQAGYHIFSLVVDGSAVTVASTYTFSNIQDDHSITASFATDTLTATETTTDETYPIEINGNVNTEQFSNMTITPYQDTETISVDFTLTGPSGTEGFCNLTLPKIAIPFGTNPVVYIDGTVAENQSFTQDFDNFYIAFATHFSTHQIEILFSTESNPSFIPIITWAPSQTSNTAPNPTTIPTPTIQPTPTTTPRPTTNPTSAPTTTLATLGQYITVAVAIIVLGAVIIGIVQRRNHSTKTPFK